MKKVSKYQIKHNENIQNTPTVSCLGERLCCWSASCSCKLTHDCIILVVCELSHYK